MIAHGLKAASLTICFPQKKSPDVPVHTESLRDIAIRIIRTVYFLRATASISTSPSLGSRATSTALRAG